MNAFLAGAPARATAIAVLSLILVEISTAQPYQGIEAIGGWDGTFVTNMSADGRVIVGYVLNYSIIDNILYPSASRGFKWEDGTFTILGNLPGYVYGEAEDVSDDGSVVAGWVCQDDDFAQVNCRAVIWNGAVPTVLPPMDPEFEHLSARAYAVSSDGGTVVGKASEDFSTDIIQWSGGSAPVPVGDFPNSWPHFVSGNGAVIGVAKSIPNRGSLFGYDASDLFLVAGGQETSLGSGGAILDISQDGSIVVGSVRQGGTNYPVYWDGSVRMNLVLPDSAEYGGIASAVSADGTVIAGHYVLEDFSRRACIWRDGEFTDVQSELESRGVDFLGGQLGTPHAISADGTVLAGRPDYSDDNFNVIYRVELGGFSLSMTAAPDTVSIGDMFTITAEIMNSGVGALNDIMPSGPLSQSGNGAVAFESGPEPASVGVLLSGESTSFTWTFVASDRGSVVFEAAITADGTDDQEFEEIAEVQVVIKDNGLTVNDTGDGEDTDHGDGLCDADDQAVGEQCTMRAALQEATALTGHVEISFDIDGDAPYLIAPESPLPTIMSGITLDATTQPGIVDQPIVRLDGSAAGPETAGLTINGDDVVVRGFMITSFSSHGIHVTGGARGLLEGLVIGTDGGGTEGLGNAGDGIHISGGTDLTIGSEDGAGKSGAINLGRVVSVANLLNGLYARSESNATLIRSDIHTVEAQSEQAAKSAGSASRAIRINLNVTNMLVGAFDRTETPKMLPNGRSGICLLGVSGAVFDQVSVAAANMHAAEVIASQDVDFRRFVAGLLRPLPQAQSDIGKILGDVFNVFQSIDITVGTDSEQDEPVQGVAAEGWFMHAEDSENVAARNVLAGLTANMAALPAPLRAAMRNLAGGIYMKNLLNGTVGSPNVATILANNGGNPLMPQAGLMAVGESSNAFRAMNLHIGTTPEGLSGIGNLGSGMILADGIVGAILGGESPAERIVSAGNMGYGYLFRDVGTAVPAKGGEIILSVSATRLISDLAPMLDGTIAGIPNLLSGFCMLRAHGVQMNMFSVGPSGRHGIESIDSNDLELLRGTIGSFFERAIESPSDLMGPVENGVSIVGGARIALGGPLGGSVENVMNMLINNAGGRGVDMDGVIQSTLANLGLGMAPSGSTPSPEALAKLGNAFEGVRIRNTVGVDLVNMLLQGNGALSPTGVGAVLVELSRRVTLRNSVMGLLSASGTPVRPNVGTAVQVSAVDSMKVLFSQILGAFSGLTSEMSTVELDGNRFEGTTGSGDAGHAVKQTGGSLTAVNNTMTSNAGPAMLFAQMEKVLVRLNNFSSNALGILNSDADNSPSGFGKAATPGTVLAPDNWWGDPSGPGGEGPGSGDAISRGVVVDTWLSSAVGIVIAPERRIVEAAEGTDVVVPIRFAAPLVAEDELDVTITDERGWVTSTTSFSVDVAGGAGEVRDLELTVGGDGANRITIHAASTTDPLLAGEAYIIISEPGGTVPLSASASAGSDVLDADGSGAFSVGGEIIINPGGANEETAMITGFGSIVLAAPLRFDHAAGEVVVPANRMAVDREESDGTVLPVSWSMHAYPNPVRQRLSIALDSPGTDEAVIELFDMLGRRVARLTDGSLTAGRHRFMIDVSGLTPGVYLARGSFEGQSLTLRVTVVR